MNDHVYKKLELTGSSPVGIVSPGSRLSSAPRASVCCRSA